MKLRYPCELMLWLSCRSLQHPRSDDLHDYDEEELLVLSETLYETVSSQVFHADPEIHPGSSSAEGTSRKGTLPSSIMEKSVNKGGS